MISLKRNLKQILVNKQHKLYEKEVTSRNLTYDGWIRKQEKNIQIGREICIKEYKSQTNEINRDKNAGYDTKNAGKCSDISEDSYLVEFIGNHSRDQSKKTQIIVNTNSLLRNIEYQTEKNITDVILITFYKGEINRIAYGIIDRIFSENENIVMIYGDEDICSGKIRENPWFKPDWSPDRFVSGFYFGGLVAVRSKELLKAYRYCKENGILEGWQRSGLRGEASEASMQLYLILYEMLKAHGGFTKGHGMAHVPVCHIRQVLFHSKSGGYEQIMGMKLPENILEKGITKKEAEKGTVLSVIIPSRDNPDVLFHCLDSLVERTRSSVPFEIILVDNGSSEENRKRISDKALRLNQAAEDGLNNVRIVRCTYLYQPMPFNFSGMCNLGAERAEGELLLFLNDDMEIIQPNWMELMIEKARLPYAGAVGVKLLYPDSHIIQHAGITNLRVGPAHKLQFLSDEEDHYFGMNRGVHNMLAVTGACLMLSKAVFEQAGGFCEELAVAFNDVDLCYTIHELGYYNIVRNDVTLYHHESLSRGRDGESPEKQQRLLRERDMLYERHEDIYGKDPYYHPYLITDMLDSKYLPAYHYQVTLDMPWSGAVCHGREIKRAREDKCLVVGMECAMDIYKWQYGALPKKGRVKAKPEDMGYYFQGYSFVIGSDNACYRKTLLLKSKDDGNIWSISVDNRYRKDIRDNLKDQVNVDLTGFAARMRRGELPAGEYQLGMLAEDQCSRQKLVNWSNWVLEVTADGE